MGQSLGTLFDGNLNALGFGTSITADEVTKNLNLKDYTAIVTGMIDVLLDVVCLLNEFMVNVSL